MVIKLRADFVEVLSQCPEDFKNKFRVAYQQLKVVDRPLDIKEVRPVAGYSKIYKLFISKSRIAMEWDGNILWITCFLYNQFLEERND